jgi:hypothetical protein
MLYGTLSGESLSDIIIIIIMTDEEWQKAALDTCFQRFKSQEQHYLAFPTRLAANMLQMRGLILKADVNDATSVNVREQTAKLFDVLKSKASNPNLIAIFRNALNSREALDAPTTVSS